MRCIKLRSCEKGFTFVELLVVTAIMAVIALALYAAFSKGIAIWQRVNREAPEEDLNLFFDKFAQDIRNCIDFKEMNLSGLRDSVEFATLVESPRLGKRTVGRVGYFYDAQKKVIQRRQMDYSSIYADENMTGQTLSGEVRSMRFQYYMLDSQVNDYIWLDEWLDKSLPLAVRVEIETKDGNGAFNASKTVTIPVGG